MRCFSLKMPKISILLPQKLQNKGGKPAFELIFPKFILIFPTPLPTPQLTEYTPLTRGLNEYQIFEYPDGIFVCCSNPLFEPCQSLGLAYLYSVQVISPPN